LTYKYSCDKVFSYIDINHKRSMRTKIMSLVAVLMLAVLPVFTSAAELSISNMQLVNAAGTSSNGLGILKVDDGQSTDIVVRFKVNETVAGTVYASFPGTATNCGVLCVATLVGGTTDVYEARATGVVKANFTVRVDGYQPVQVMNGAKVTRINNAFIADFDAPVAPEMTAPNTPTRAKNVVLGWQPSNDLSGIKSYTLTARKVGAADSFTTTVAGNLTSMVTDAVPFDGEIDFTIVATDNAGRQSAVSNTKRVTLDRTAPATPTGLVGSVQESATPLSWNAVSGAALYRIYRNGQEVGTTSTSTFTDRVDNVSGVYTYTVAAEDDLGNLSGRSAGFVTSAFVRPNGSNTNTSGNINTDNNVNTSTPLVSGPTGLRGSVNSVSTTLNWNAVACAENYVIYRDNREIGRTTSREFTFSVDNVNREYEYFVRAICGGQFTREGNRIRTLGVPAGTTTRVVTRTVFVDVPVEVLPAVEEPVENTNTAVNIPLNLGTNSSDDLGDATQATAFGLRDLLRAWWFWLILLLIALAGAIWLYVYRRDEEEEESMNIDITTPPQQ
jgi:hypothetical protein